MGEVSTALSSSIAGIFQRRSLALGDLYFPVYVSGRDKYLYRRFDTQLQFVEEELWRRSSERVRLIGNGILIE